MNTKYTKIIISVFCLFFSFETVFGAEIFNRQLKLGDTGPDVMFLQQVLNTDAETLVDTSGVGSSGNETNYFGLKTKNAVIKFQEKYRDEILSPLGLSSGTGVVGPKTLQKLNSLTGGQANQIDQNTTQVNNTNVVVSSNSSAGNNFNTNIDSASEVALPRVLSINPIIIFDPKNTEVKIGGLNFDKKSRVFLLTNRTELFDNLEIDSSGTEIKVKLATALEDDLEDVLNSSTEEQKTLIINTLKSQYETYNDYGIFVGASLFVQNSLGDSNIFPLKINIYRNDTTIPKN